MARAYCRLTIKGQEWAMGSIRDVLGSSSAARATAQLDLGAGQAVAVWENQSDRVSYQRASDNVFSLYLAGGAGTRRVDRRDCTGFPGAICIMPRGHSSEWEVTTAHRFVHLYLPDDALKAGFAQIHDCDARRLDLPEVTLVDMPHLIAPLTGLSRAAQAQDRLAAEIALADLLARLGARQIVLKGGLAPHLSHRIDDWIEAHLDGAIRLADLARLVDLSPFHLHRMFRLSRGMTLQDWITTRRIDRAKLLLRGRSPLIEVAVACGFASQSHLTRVFKARTMLTPAAYRAALKQGGARPLAI